MTDSALRNRLRRAIFAACRRAGLDNGARHVVQKNVIGKASMTEMSTDDLRRLLDHMNGYSPSGRARKKPEPAEAPAKARPERRPDILQGVHAGKLRALWRSGYWLGVIEDDSDKALAAFVRNQTGLDAARWATPVQTAQCIEALKDWLTRDAGVNWKPYVVDGGPNRVAPAARVLEAMWRKLAEAGAVRIDDTGALHHWCVRATNNATTYHRLTPRQQNDLVIRLGRWLREVTGAK